MSEQSKQQIRVVVAVSHVLLCDGVTSILRNYADILPLAQTYYAHDVLELVHSFTPDVLILDENLAHEIDDKALHATLSQNNIALLALGFASENNQFTSTEPQTASAYLSTDCTSLELIATLRSIAYAQNGTNPPQSAWNISVFEDEFAKLTQREREIAIHVAEGETNAQIARTLNISIDTVKTHIKHILSKINASNRTQIATLLYESTMLKASAKNAAPSISIKPLI